MLQGWQYPWPRASCPCGGGRCQRRNTWAGLGDSFLLYLEGPLAWSAGVTVLAPRCSAFPWHAWCRSKFVEVHHLLTLNAVAAMTGRVCARLGGLHHWHCEQGQSVPAHRHGPLSACVAPCQRSCCSHLAVIGAVRKGCVRRQSDLCLSVMRASCRILQRVRRFVVRPLCEAVCQFLVADGELSPCPLSPRAFLQS